MTDKNSTGMYFIYMNLFKPTLLKIVNKIVYIWTTT